MMAIHSASRPLTAARHLLALWLCLLAVAPAWAFESFVVEDIRVEGLQRISAGTVFNYLPVKRGDTLDEALSAQAIRALYKTGFFKDVVLEREGQTLVVFAAERPAIASIEINGNEDIPSKELTDNLNRIGIAEGRVFNRSMLDRVEQELKRTYLAQGKYDVRIKSTITPLERNRVGVRIDIAEGEVSSIHQVRLIGVSAFPEEELLERFESGPAPAFSLFSSRDQYSKQKLSGDVENLRSYYMNRGYINFDVESTQVSISPDRKYVYITVNIHEGEAYTVSEVEIAGETVVPKKVLRELIDIQAGDLFSRQAVSESSTRLSERLGEEGYAFANVNAIPEPNDEKREVKLTFFVDPGKRAYVRRINISGNSRTRDEVIRRELRQMESAWLSTTQVKLSRNRLNRLGFFDSVNVETPMVPGAADMVDVDVSVIERDTFGSLNFGIGYGETSGLLLNASIDQENFLGTGKRFSMAVNSSEVSDMYSLTFVDPYYTLDGVSRSINLNYRVTDAGAADVSDFSTDTYGAGMSFGIPVSEYDRVGLGGEYEFTRMYVADDAAVHLLDFIADNGDEVEVYKVNASWTHDTRDRAIFPTSGNRQKISSEVAVPEGSTYYKLRYDGRLYLPVTKGLTFLARTDLSYGDSYDDLSVLPPFERYYAGGTRTVRGYRGNSLGTEATRDIYGDPIGGNARVIANLELIFPAPFAENSNTVRLTTFIDGGNVFDTREEEVDLDELRYSYGASMIWLAPVGALKFSYAWPLNDKPGDETERFQFTMGTLY